MKAKLIALGSWAGLLASTISELGFDIDFPLTPTIWLVIAFCAVILATAQVAICSRIHSIGKREPGTYLSGAVLLKKAPAEGSGPTRHADFGAFVVGRVPSRGDSCLRSVILTVNNAVPALTFLSPATTRGPPCSDSQFDSTLGRPARHFFSAPHTSAIHFSSSSPLIINTTNGEPA